MMGLSVTFLWILAHIGVKGNEAADRAAKKTAAHNYMDMTVTIGKTTTKSIIRQRLRQMSDGRSNGKKKGKDGAFIKFKGKWEK